MDKLELGIERLQGLFEFVKAGDYQRQEILKLYEYFVDHYGVDHVSTFADCNEFYDRHIIIEYSEGEKLLEAQIFIT